LFYRDADTQVEYDDALDSLLLRTKILHFSCWPVSRNPARRTLETAIGTMRRNGGLVCFDPNYHPALWNKDEDGIAVVRDMISRADIVKPSEDDAERIFGPDTPEAQLGKFIALGPRLVILTLGRQGALVSNGLETVKFDSLATEVVDATGAGDAFWGGFYAALIKGYALGGALRTGFAASAYKLRFLGAVVAMPDLETLRTQYGFVSGMQSKR